MRYQYSVACESERGRERESEGEGERDRGPSNWTGKACREGRGKLSFFTPSCSAIGLFFFLPTSSGALNPDRRRKLHRLEMKAEEHSFKSESTSGGVHLASGWENNNNYNKKKSDFSHKYSWVFRWRINILCTRAVIWHSQCHSEPEYLRQRSVAELQSQWTAHTWKQKPTCKPLICHIPFIRMTGLIFSDYSMCAFVRVLFLASALMEWRRWHQQGDDGRDVFVTFLRIFAQSVQSNSVFFGCISLQVYR